MANHELFSHHATVLRVLDMKRSLEFYESKLGFEITFGWQEPITYAVLKHGHVSIHLSLAEKDDPTRKSTIYFFIQDIDKLYKEYQLKGFQFHTDIGDRDYQMRDFDLLDPDGHMLTFGKGIN